MQVKILIKNGHVLDPAAGRDGMFDVLVEDGMIAAVTPSDVQAVPENVDRVIDAAGQYVMPGFIDLHVHFRDPGLEYKETMETGAKAAARGGYTTVCTMPNTKPVQDTVEHLQLQLDRIKEYACVNVLPVGAVTMGQMGAELSEIEGMKKAGACAISEDGKSVMNSNLYREAMRIAARLGMPVLAHCEDINLVDGGVMNAGGRAGELGMRGISNAVEDVITARDILLAKETGARLHLCHCSTEDSVKMVAAAKAEGLPVTAEVCPHHFTLTEDDIPADDANYKMNPPLRGRADVDALIAGLRDGIMDVIATDHAPHSAEEKAKSMKESPFGIVGLETAFCLTVSELVEKGILTPMQLVEKMSYNPAKVLGIPKGTLQEGHVADIVIADFKKEWQIDVNDFASKGKNSPFHGRKVTGQVTMTLVDGKVVYER